MPSSQPENHLDNDKAELKTGLMKCVSVDLTHIVPNESTFYISKLQDFIDQYTQSKLKAFAEEVKQLIEKSKEDNLDYHGRPDCKNCSLIEDLEALKAIKERWNLNG